jgi:hypothetical protein
VYWTDVQLTSFAEQPLLDGARAQRETRNALAGKSPSCIGFAGSGPNNGAGAVSRETPDAPHGDLFEP